MDVKEYTVSDANGKIDVSIKGTIVEKDSFTFYVQNTSGTTEPSLEVKIVMPLGGTESGLFRFPRVGEKVLVVSDENVHYLMGYLPTYTENSQDFQTDGMFQNDGQGEVFRYQQTGKKEGKAPAGEKYSEIGFYHRRTQWATSTDEYEDLDGGCPKIDQLNIHSTGDIHESAVNHHRVQAKRFELLVNAKNGKVLPLGDNPGDDSGLHAGDVHIRAGNRVVIKAGKEIILQVGKTVLKISDGGLNIVSKMINTNISNPYDAKVDINNGGISLSGFSVTINSVKAFGIGDSFGGGLKSSLGVVSIGGREIKAEAYDSAQFKTLVTSALMSYGLSVKAGVEGITGLSILDMVDKATDSEYFNKIKDVLNGRSSNDSEDTAPKDKNTGGGGTKLYASPLQIITFTVECGKEIYELGKRILAFTQKLTGMPDKIKEVKRLGEEKKLEAKNKAEEEARKAKEEADNKLKKEEKMADSEKKEREERAEKEKNDAIKQAELDKASGKITEAEKDKRIKAAQEKEEKAKAEAAARAEKVKAEAAARKAIVELDEDKKLKQATIVADEVEAKRKADEDEKEAKKIADKIEKEAKEDAEKVLIEKDKSNPNMSEADRKKAVEKMNAAKKEAEEEAKKKREKAEKEAKEKREKAEKEAKEAREKAEDDYKKGRETPNKTLWGKK